jgi:hypothetical protein
MGFMDKIRGKKKKVKSDKDTFKITEGKIKTNLEKYAEDLRFSVEEGYSDQDVMNNAMVVEAEIENLRKKLKDVI